MKRIRILLLFAGLVLPSLLHAGEGGASNEVVQPRLTTESHTNSAFSRVNQLTDGGVDPIVLVRPEATIYSGTPRDLACVVDGVEAGPLGWSVGPNNTQEPQALVVRCDRPVEADELDMSLFFLAGRPLHTIAEFTLSYTTDAEPSLNGNWKLLEVQRFNAEVATLRRTAEGRLHAEPIPFAVTGHIPDDVYRITVRLPGGRATGFRLDVFPVRLNPERPLGLSWYSPYGFYLTEFRASVHARKTTNIALHRPVKASHALFFTENAADQNQTDALTDGLPATIAHPQDPGLGASFYFELDLGRVADIDHIGLRNRGDLALDRLSRMLLRLYEQDPTTGAAPVWVGMDRADGSHPEAGEVDIIRAGIGAGTFRGRYLRLSTSSSVPSSPQLAEVEVYESRTPEVVAVLADGLEIPMSTHLDVPAGVRRLSIQLRIPQIGLPPGVSFRWRVTGELESWQESRLMSVDIACPHPGNTVFEAQALHSDGLWDATLYRLPIHARQFFWQTSMFRWITGIGVFLLATGLGVFWSRRRVALQLDRLQMESALAEERRRIARDIHDDLGSGLTRISIIAAGNAAVPRSPEKLDADLATIRMATQKMILTMDQIVWVVNPQNDTLEAFVRYLGEFAQEFLESTGLSLRLDLPLQLPAWAFPSRLRHNLLLAFKEALNNTVKHAAADTVVVALRIEDRRIRIVVRDDGCGFASPRASGNGLNNMASRLESLGGSCQINSTLGQGTSVEFELQLPFVQNQAR